MNIGIPASTSSVSSKQSDLNETIHHEDYYSAVVKCGSDRVLGERHTNLSSHLNLGAVCARLDELQQAHSDNSSNNNTCKPGDAITTRKRCVTLNDDTEDSDVCTLNAHYSNSVPALQILSSNPYYSYLSDDEFTSAHRSPPDKNSPKPVPRARGRMIIESSGSATGVKADPLTKKTTLKHNMTDLQIRHATKEQVQYIVHKARYDRRSRSLNNEPGCFYENVDAKVLGRRQLRQKPELKRDRLAQKRSLSLDT